MADFAFTKVKVWASNSFVRVIPLCLKPCSHQSFAALLWPTRVACQRIEKQSQSFFCIVLSLLQMGQGLIHTGRARCNANPLMLLACGVNTLIHIRWFHLLCVALCVLCELGPMQQAQRGYFIQSERRKPWCEMALNLWSF